MEHVNHRCHLSTCLPYRFNASYAFLNLLLRLCSFIYCQHPVSDCTHSKSLHNVTLLLISVIMFLKEGDDIEAAINLGLIIAQKKHCNKTTKRKQLYFIHPLLLFSFSLSKLKVFSENQHLAVVCTSSELTMRHQVEQKN